MLVFRPPPPAALPGPLLTLQPYASRRGPDSLPIPKHLHHPKTMSLELSDEDVAPFVDDALSRPVALMSNDHVVTGRSKLQMLHLILSNAHISPKLTGPRPSNNQYTNSTRPVNLAPCSGKLGFKESTRPFSGRCTVCEQIAASVELVIPMHCDLSQARSICICSVLLNTSSQLHSVLILTKSLVLVILLIRPSCCCRLLAM